jgi:ABC-type antimicrobial peptide transport system permease subunit
MRRRVLVSSFLFSLLSGLYWFAMGHWLNLIAPMMLNDGAEVRRTLLWTLAALIVYVAVATAFLTWVTSRSKD